MNYLKLIAGVATLIALALVPTAQGADKDAKPKDKPYTLETCIVSDEKLGDMGEPFVFGYKGQEFKMCCKSCKKDFDKEPQKYVKKLEEELKKKQKK